MIYPKPDGKEKWIKAMNEVVQKGFMSKEELNLCLEAGGMPEDLLEKVRLRMDLFYNQFKAN